MIGLEYKIEQKDAVSKGTDIENLPEYRIYFPNVGAIIHYDFDSISVHFRADSKLFAESFKAIGGEWNQEHTQVTLIGEREFPDNYVERLKSAEQSLKLAEIEHSNAAMHIALYLR
mgnify:FL=1|jgi:hypothetical protein